MKKRLLKLCVCGIVGGMLSGQTALASSQQRSWEELIQDREPAYTEESNKETAQSYCAFVAKNCMPGVAILGSGRWEVRRTIPVKYYHQVAYGRNFRNYLTVNVQKEENSHICYENINNNFSALIPVFKDCGGLDIIILENLNIQDTGHERHDYYYRSQKSTENLLKILRPGGRIVLPPPLISLNSRESLSEALQWNESTLQSLKEKIAGVDSNLEEAEQLQKDIAFKEGIIEKFKRQLDLGQKIFPACHWKPEGNERYKLLEVSIDEGTFRVFAFLNNSNRPEYVFCEKGFAYLSSSENGRRELGGDNHQVYGAFLNEFFKDNYMKVFDFDQEVGSQLNFELVQKGSDLWPQDFERKQKSSWMLVITKPSESE